VDFVLLLFKLAVIVPVITCFAYYWKNYGSESQPVVAADETISTRPDDHYRSSIGT